MSRRSRDRSATSGEVEPRERPVGGGKASSTAPPLSRTNLLLGALGVATVLAGFALLAGGSIVAAPILLVVGFLGFFPLALYR